MVYQCPKGHQSTDPDYCSECGALIGKPKISNSQPVMQNTGVNVPSGNAGAGQEICPDCGTLREGNARFCEVCRHDFQENKTGVAEVIVASKKASRPQDEGTETAKENAGAQTVKEDKPVDAAEEVEKTLPQKLDLVISVDRDRVSSWDGESPIKPDTVDRVFPLDLDENLVGRRSKTKGIYPEIEINDPGVSHRHLKFTRQKDGGFAVLELGSANGTELNGSVLEPGVNTVVKAGDELAIGIWTRLKIVSR